MPRIFRGVLVALATVVVGVSGCTTTPSGPPQTTITWPQETSDALRLLLVGSGSTLYAVWGDRSVVIAGPQGTPTPTRLPKDDQQPGSETPQQIAVDPSGQVWLIRSNQQVTTFLGVDHPASAAVSELGRGSITLPTGRVVPDRLVSEDGLAILDGTTLLASTYTGGRTLNPDQDVLINRVTASGHDEVAGRWRTNPPDPLSGVPEGTSVPAGSVDLGVVRRVAALAPDRIAFVVGTVSGTIKRDSRLSLAVLEAGTVRRVPIPALCPSDYDATLVRLSDRVVLLGAPAPRDNGECRSVSAARTWLRVDVVDGTSQVLATDTETLAVVGDRIVTATTTHVVDTWTTRITWGS
ncbi:MAG: hypothetical protein BWY91_00290 [bacterium ADurb.BinA028]|jgi:hypothetical protein|nr:MAG: hypothetical protein BWY91_00290 [bacterium ADurb.BinA028]